MSWESNCLAKGGGGEIELIPVLFIGPIGEVVVTENECVGITGVSIAVVHRDDVVVVVVVFLPLCVLGSGSWVLVVSGHVLAVLGVLTKSTKALHGRVAVVGSCERCSSEAGNCKGLVHFEVSW